MKADFQDGPIYYKKGYGQKFKLQSNKSKYLTFQNVICSVCNNTLTQPYDLAWEQLSKYFRNETLVESNIRCNRIFPYNTKHYMRHVHLYFLKILGCAIKQENIPVDITGFSEKLICDRLHPNFYIGFFTTLSSKTQKSNVIPKINQYDIAERGKYLSWYLFFNHVTISLMYKYNAPGSIQGEDWHWHPKQGRQTIQVINFDELYRRLKEA